jgi:RNA polymerase sigma-70 factor (ECF subfamily)
MPDAPDTRASLLLRLKGPRDERAWTEFVAIYTPLIEAVARARGLQPADAADLAQDVFRAVAAAIDRYDLDPDRGSFRAWLFRIARNLAINLTAARCRQAQGTGDTAMLEHLHNQPASSADSDLFDAEYRRSLFRWAAGEIQGEFREGTWQAFWQTGVEGQDPKAVAEALGISVGAVYIARSRVMARLKAVIARVEATEA